MDIVLSGSGCTVSFPVLPESYTVTTAQGNTTVNINALGEVNLLGHPNLEEVSFSGIFPAQSAPYTSGSLRDPMDYVTDIRTIKEGGPAELHLLDIQAMHCTVESFSFGESDGTGDITFDITLKQYVYINAKGAVDKRVSKLGRPTPASARNGNSYTVKSGDSLVSIARTQMGTSEWSELYETNKETIGSNPNLILPGMVLTIPE